MLNDVELAVRAYADARSAVDDAERVLAQRRSELPRARQELRDAIVAASKAGARQREIVAVTGYTRESVRRILRAAGVEAPE